jgi:hypothetical protein
MEASRRRWKMPGILAGVPMAASKRPSTSSLRRFITSRPYVTVAELRRRFALDDPDAMSCVAHEGRQVYVGLPEREALKIDDLLGRGEIGLELSVEVRAPVAVGVYPLRIAHYVIDGPLDGSSNGSGNGTHTPRQLPSTGGAASPGDPQPALLADPPPDSTTLPAPLTPDHAAPPTPEHGALVEVEGDRPLDGEAAEAMNGNGHASASRARDARSTRHNGRPASHRHRGSRHHRPHAGPGAAPGHPPPGPQ